MEYIGVKSVLSARKDGSWFGIDYNVNLYRGCNHGCIYYDSRSDCYEIKHFDTVRLKRNVLEILCAELKKKREKGVVGMGSMSDCYNKEEAEFKVTEGALRLLDRFGFGVAMITKNSSVVRDYDIYKSISTHSPVLIKMTVTSLDEQIVSKIEPKASAVKKRFAALSKLSAAGLYTGIMLTPVLPFITDTEENVVQIVKAAAGAGCKFVYSPPFMGMTLRDSQRAFYYRKLDKFYPGLQKRYADTYGASYECASPASEKLYKTLFQACEENGLTCKMEEIVEGYKRRFCGS